jgi:hypothetical protein
VVEDRKEAVLIDKMTKGGRTMQALIHRLPPCRISGQINVTSDLREGKSIQP